MPSTLSSRPWALTQDANEFSLCQFVVNTISDPPQILRPKDVQTKNGESGVQMMYWGYANCPMPPAHFTNSDAALAKFGRVFQSKVFRRLLTVRNDWSRK